MYVSPNFPTRKALREAVANGETVLVFSPGPFPAPMNGEAFIEGPCDKGAQMSDQFKNLSFQTVHCPVVGQVDVVFGQYVSNKRVSISIRDSLTGEPVMTASVNHPSAPCPDDEVWIKEYSENLGVTRWLILRGVIEEQPTDGFQGSYDVMHWRYKLTQQSLEAITQGVKE